jgi:hypothetical protein
LQKKKAKLSKANCLKYNLNNIFLGLDNYFSLRIIDKANNQYIKIVKIKGQEIAYSQNIKMNYSTLQKGCF